MSSKIETAIKALATRVTDDRDPEAALELARLLFATPLPPESFAAYVLRLPAFDMTIGVFNLLCDGFDLARLEAAVLDA